MTRALQPNLALLCCLAAVALAPTARALTVEQEAGGLRVRAAAYSALVDPANGGRITSLVVDGAEVTRLCADGHGGLFEETHSADFPFDVLRQDADGRRLTLTLAARAGALRIVKEFAFSDDRPAFTVRLTFQNSAPFALSGADAPALRHLVLPAGGQATGRELYCTARTRGAEVLSADFLLARAYAAAGPAAALRWMAVSEPAGRRALGFALTEGGSRALPPLRAQGGGLLTGWSAPAVPAGSSLTVGVVVVPLRAFTAVAELNAHFAADAVLGAGGVIHLSLMPLESMPDLSIITRTYDAGGRELEPCDPLLLDRLEPFKVRQGDVVWPAGARLPAWFVHEVYGGGRKLGAFAVPVGQPAGPSPSAAERLPDPAAAALPGMSRPDADIPLTADRRQRGFLLWHFDGPPATDEAQDVRLALTAGERATVFFGLRALRPIAALRLTLAPAAPLEGGTAPAPPSAVYLWRVVDDAAGLARLEPLNGASLKEGETAWLALTADAGRLVPGRYAGRLVVSADGAARELPLDLRIVPSPGASAGGFGLWYLGTDGVGPIDGPTVQKLADYGVRALALPLDGATAAAVRSGLPDAQLGRMGMLAFAGSDGVLPPAAPAPGALPLPCPDPLWMLRVGASTPAAAHAAVRAGYSPALLCERLTAVPLEFFGAAQGGAAAGKGSRPVWLVEDGAEPDAVPRLITSGAMDARTPVWLYLDLRGVDWRCAAIRVRSAVWAAAWQGLAGLAVACDPPAPEVDRQLVLWHILHDACGEAALWRQAGRTAAPQQGLEAVIGTDGRSILPVRLERVPFRQIYRVAPAGEEGASLRPFAQARLRTVELAAQPGAEQPEAGEGRLYWRGIPLLEGTRVRWAIFAPAGQDQAQRAAVSFGRALERLAGRPVPLVRSWPEPGPDGPALVWAFADQAAWPALPEQLRTALGKRSGAAFLAADLEGGAAAVVVRPGADVGPLLNALQTMPDLYPTAGGVR